MTITANTMINEGNTGFREQYKGSFRTAEMRPSTLKKELVILYTIHCITANHYSHLPHT